MTRYRLLFVMILTAVISSSVTGLVVNHWRDNSDSKVVQELRREEQSRKAEEAVARHWMTQPLQKLPY
jgi:hypothetical protein